jgi:hypothetical protein
MTGTADMRGCLRVREYDIELHKIELITVATQDMLTLP